MSLFTPKEVGESVVLTFDFSASLAVGETITSVTSPVVTINSGVDAAPAGILNGAAQVAPGALAVLVPVHAGLANTSYNIDVVVATSNAAKVLALTSTIQVLPI